MINLQPPLTFLAGLDKPAYHPDLFVVMLSVMFAACLVLMKRAARVRDYLSLLILALLAVAFILKVPALIDEQPLIRPSQLLIAAANGVTMYLTHRLLRAQEKKLGIPGGTHG